MSPELEAAIEAARRAGRLQMDRFRRHQAVETKADDTPVTETDRECEALIRAHLVGGFPGYGFLGEESEEVHGEGEAGWIVDPLDGTKKYVRGLPFFGPSIALERDGELQLGVLYLPALGELLWAERGGGAFLNGTPIRVSETVDLARAYVVGGEAIEFFRRGWGGVIEAVAIQSYHDPGFLDLYTYASVACGRIDGVVMVGESAWDIAAASVIVEEAGGQLTDFRGVRTVHSGTSVTSNGRLHEQLLALVASCA
jgi:histidinol phosphatase-like enzyme (inositol monophosphatase family)